jgi:hypothetical protein
METKGKVTSLRDVVASRIACFRLNDLDLGVPTLIALRKQQDVVKWMIERMDVTHAFSMTVLVTQHNISMPIHILLSGARNDGGHLIHRGQVISTMIISGLQHYGHLQVALHLGRTFVHDLIGLLIQRDKRIVGIQHVLKFSHEHMIKVGVTVVAGGKGGLLIIDVELGIAWGTTFWRV